MSTLNNVSTLEQLGERFIGLFERRVFRLLTLDYYDAANEHEPYAQYLAGEPVDPVWRESWKGLVRGVRESGRVMERVHVVSEPVSDYVRFSLLHGYPASVRAGEDVRVLDMGLAGENGLVPWDFWLFDDDLATILNYDEAGRAGRVEPLDRLDQPDMLGVLRDARRLALRLAVPLAQYVAEHNITDERTRTA